MFCFRRRTDVLFNPLYVRSRSSLSASCLGRSDFRVPEFTKLHDFHDFPGAAAADYRALSSRHWAAQASMRSRVAVHVVGRVALQLDDDVLVVGVAGLLQQHLHDLRVDVLLQLGVGVVPVRAGPSAPAPACLASPRLATRPIDLSVTHRPVSRSYSVAESTRSTTTRSIQLRGNRSQACQSMMHPPALTSSSMASRSYVFYNVFTSRRRPVVSSSPHTAKTG